MLGFLTTITSTIYPQQTHTLVIKQLHLSKILLQILATQTHMYILLLYVIID
jgi:hypothetical protein